MIDVYSRQSTSAASLVCQWRPSASVEADTAVCVLHLHRTVARVVVTEKGIYCRSEDVVRENVSVSRLGEGYLQAVSVICWAWSAQSLTEPVVSHDGHWHLVGASM